MNIYRPGDSSGVGCFGLALPQCRKLRAIAWNTEFLYRKERVSSDCNNKNIFGFGVISKFKLQPV